MLICFSNFCSKGLRGAGSSNSEIEIDNIKLDKLTAEYLTEIKKSDADEEAAKWQLYYYLYVLKSKGIERKGRLQFVEKNKSQTKTVILELSPEVELELKEYIAQIEDLLEQDTIPEVFNKAQCKKCAYYEYCYI